MWMVVSDIQCLLPHNNLGLRCSRVFSSLFLCNAYFASNCLLFHCRYAHFDGEWVARQLEIHPNGVLLLVAGRDDLDMCELSLSQCGLTRRPGAEIISHEFEAVWQKHGGANQEYRASVRK